MGNPRVMIESEYTMKNQYVVISFFLSGIIIFAVALIKPFYNWDMIGYVACVKNFETHDPDILHKWVYDELKKSVPERDYNRLVTGHFREPMSKNPKVFAQQLPFYQIRPLYNFSVYFFTKLGLNAFFATHLISAISVLLGLWLIYFSFKPYINNYLLFLLPILGGRLILLDIARFSTPDGLAFLFIIMATYSVLKKHWSIFLLLPASILVRTDLLIYALLMLACLFVSYKNWRIPVVTVFIMCVTLYFAINKFYGSYGWSSVFSYTFIHKYVEPANVIHKVTFSDYFSVWFAKKYEILLDIPFFIYIIVMFYSAFMCIKKYGLRVLSEITKPENIILSISLISFGYVVIHVILFPVVWPRFFAGQYLLGTLGLFFLLTQANKCNSKTDV